LGGQSDDSPDEMAVARACSMRVMGFMGVSRCGLGS
jgi:hypothetical protein